MHTITFEDIKKRKKNLKYPKCIEGERAYLPEDCDSVPGYYELLKILKSGKGKEYKEKVWWLKNHIVNYYPYNPDSFDSKKVKFFDPDVRWNMAFKKS